MLDDKLRALLMKLKALADQGVGGEKENAAQMLQRLMHKHGITMEDISDEVKHQREFFVSEQNIKLFFQVLATVIDADTVGISRYKKDTKKLKSRFVDLTDAQYIEMQAKWDFYSRAWKEERDAQLALLMKAFIHKNRIFPASDGCSKDEDDEPMTAEQLEEMERIISLMGGMKRHHFTKQISNG